MYFAIVEMTVTDADKFAAYAKDAGSALQKWGASPAAQGPATQVFGEGEAPARAVVLTFPDKDAAMGWVNDPELAALHALRQSAGDCKILLVGD